MITALAFALMTGAVQGGQEEPLKLELFRTRAAAGVTAVDAIAEMDPRWLFDDDRCMYGVEVIVHDSSGAEVLRDSWRRPADCDVFRDDADARVIDTFSFGVGSGRYAVEMRVTPASGGEPRIVRRTLESLERGARASDLYLAREVGWADSADAGGWAIRKGGLGIAAEADLKIPSSRPFLGYYVELYEQTQPLRDGAVQATIRRPQGGRIAEFTLQRIDSLAEGRPVAGTVSLVGLPPGRYALDVSIRFAGVPEVVRSHGFELVQSGATPTAPAASASEAEELRSYFEGLADADLDRFDAVAVWMTSEEARRGLRSLSPEGRREFLIQFFQRAALPGEGTGVVSGVEALRLFLERVRLVEREFSELSGEERRPAWQTDRGRIVMLRGMPDDRIRRPMPPSDTRPYEIWYYNIGSGYVYLFADESGFGHYRMLYSTDPSMVTLPDWARRAGPAAVSELSAYYGVQERY